MSTSTKRGFTLIELLVVIAIIALLIGILLPSLGGARDVARSVVCQGSRLRELANAQQQYALDNEEWYAGRNTTGFYDPIYFRLEVYEERKLDPRYMVTSWFDWISPVLGDAMSMPDNRAERTAFIFNTLGDPASIVYNDTIYAGQGRRNLLDFDEFDEVLGKRGIRQVSYLTPLSMHLHANDQIAELYQKLLPTIRGNKIKRPPQSWESMIGEEAEFAAPRRFRPRMDLVAVQPSSKVIVSDGTRYYAGDARILDFDPSPYPRYYGSFSSSAPSYHESTTFGRDFDRRNGFEGDDTNVDLTFRHPGHSINAARFDGSVVSIRSHEAWSDPAPWWPSGSVYTGRGEPTPEIQAKFSVGDELP